MIHFLRLFDLFRRHVMRRADRPFRVRQHYVRLAPRDFGNAKIGNFHPPFFVQQNVLRLDVAMDDAFVMRELQRLANLRHDLQCFARLEFAGPLQLPQIQPIHKLHDEEGQPVHLAEFVQRHDIGMAQLCQCPRFAIEPLGKTRTAGHLRRQNFQRHQPIQRRLPRFIDRPHPAFADEPQNFELRKEPGHFFQARWLERRQLGLGGCFCALLEQTCRAQTLQRARRQCRPALRTFLFHVWIRFVLIHTPFSEAKPRKCYRKLCRVAGTRCTVVPPRP